MKRARAERLVFVISLVALMALGAWWSVAMSRAVEQSYAHKRIQLEAETVQPTSEQLAELDAWLKRRRLMVFGEGGLLMMLTAVCCFMLFRLAAEQRRFREQLEAFVGQATHELKTPLAGLRALLQTVQLGRLPAEQLEQAVDLGLRQIDRQERLIQNLLMGHRLRFAEGSLESQRLEPLRLIERLLRERGGVGHRGCAFALNGGAGLGVFADTEGLQTIVENLLENALRYGAETVHVGLDREDENWVRLSVRDDGQGFEPERAEEIFGPFRRAAPDVRGTGLGLPLSRSLAEAMGGTLAGVSAGLGRGAEFTLRLRAADMKGSEDDSA
jgi:signal transduction histidine kinase